MITGLAALLALAVFFFVLFVRKEDLPEVIPASPVQHLDDRKHAIYDNLRDLQFEYRLGKLSDEDYQSTKRSLQRELAGVLAETEETLKTLGLSVSKPASTSAAPPAVSKLCPHCSATFSKPLRFCGECGKAMA